MNKSAATNAAASEHQHAAVAMSDLANMIYKTTGIPDHSGIVAALVDGTGYCQTGDWYDDERTVKRWVKPPSHLASYTLGKRDTTSTRYQALCSGLKELSETHGHRTLIQSARDSGIQALKALERARGGFYSRHYLLARAELTNDVTAVDFNKQSESYEKRAKEMFGGLDSNEHYTRALDSYYQSKIILEQSAGLLEEACGKVPLHDTHSYNAQQVRTVLDAQLRLMSLVSTYVEAQDALMSENERSS